MVQHCSSVWATPANISTLCLPSLGLFWGCLQITATSEREKRCPRGCVPAQLTFFGAGADGICKHSPAAFAHCRNLLVNFALHYMCSPLGGGCMHKYGFSHCSLAVASALPLSCISLLTSKSPMIGTEAFSMYSVF